MKYQLNKEYTERLKQEIKEKEPSLFQVILHNDDFTPKEFVIEMLEKFFFMDREKASAVTMEAHMEGLSIVCVASKDFAEEKALQVVDFARENDFPLICSASIAV